MSATPFDEIATQLDQALETIKAQPKSFQHSPQKAELVRKCIQLEAALMTPRERISAIQHHISLPMCVRVATDAKLFTSLLQRPLKLDELASTTNVPLDLVRRVLRMLEYFCFVQMSNDGTYHLTEMGRLMTVPSVVAGLRLNFEEEFFVMRTMPEYFQTTGYKMPSSMTNTPFQYAYQTELDNHTFWAQKKPDTMQLLQTYLEGYNHASIWDLYPIQNVFGDGDVFVDVAGGHGSHLEAARQACSNVRGQYVLQELPEVLNMNHDLSSAIRKMPHNMMTSQPVTKARIYLLSNVLHDHPDEVCRTILKHIKEAMKPQYSKLLISTFIMSEAMPLLRHIQMDFTMLALSGGKQRTKAEWLSLIESVGLEIVQVWEPDTDQNGIVECEVV